jgi:hypothetical protein
MHAHRSCVGEEFVGNRLNSQLLHTQSAVIAFVGANCATRCWSHYPIDRAMVVTSLGQPALQLGNRRSLAVSVSGVAVVTRIVPRRRIIPVRIIGVVKRVGNAPGPIGVRIPVVRITIIVPVRRIIPIRIIAVAKRVRNAPTPRGVPTPGNAPAPRGVPTPVVRITKSTDEGESVTVESMMTPIATPITATPVSTSPVAVFSRFATAEFRPASAELVSASRRFRAKMFAVFGMIPAVSTTFAMSAVFRRNSANGQGDRENDRKERFHSTKYSLVTARVRLPDFAAMCFSNKDFSSARITPETPRRLQPALLRLAAIISQ